MRTRNPGVSRLHNLEKINNMEIFYRELSDKNWEIVWVDMDRKTVVKSCSSLSRSIVQYQDTPDSDGFRLIQSLIIDAKPNNPTVLIKFITEEEAALLVSCR